MKTRTKRARAALQLAAAVGAVIAHFAQLGVASLFRLIRPRPPKKVVKKPPKDPKGHAPKLPKAPLGKIEWVEPEPPAAADDAVQGTPKAGLRVNASPLGEGGGGRGASSRQPPSHAATRFTRSSQNASAALWTATRCRRACARR